MRSQHRRKQQRGCLFALCCQSEINGKSTSKNATLDRSESVCTVVQEKLPAVKVGFIRFDYEYSYPNRLHMSLSRCHLKTAVYYTCVA
jgi:hypothetical protein